MPCHTCLLGRCNPPANVSSLLVDTPVDDTCTKNSLKHHVRAPYPNTCHNRTARVLNNCKGLPVQRWVPYSHCLRSWRWTNHARSSSSKSAMMGCIGEAAAASLISQYPSTSTRALFTHTCSPVIYVRSEIKVVLSSKSNTTGWHTRSSNTW